MFKHPSSQGGKAQESENETKFHVKERIWGQQLKQLEMEVKFELGEDEGESEDNEVVEQEAKASEFNMKKRLHSLQIEL